MTLGIEDLADTWLCGPLVFSMPHLEGDAENGGKGNFFKLTNFTHSRE